jgi:succinylglutamic semialdehyde dehydrogenase
MIELKNYIDGQWQKVGGGATLTSFDPASEVILAQGAAASEQQVALAAAAADRAFPSWAGLSIVQRQGYLESFAAALKQNQRPLVETISHETGKPLWESETEVQAMIQKITLSIQAHTDRCREVSASLGKIGFRHTRFKPHGPVAVIGPFNLPGHLPNGHIIPALLAGNTVVFKPSELTPLTGQRLMELWHKIDLPAGVLNLIHGDGMTGQHLLEQQVFKGIFFTGSFATGQAIHRRFAGRPEVILALEMGGNNPLVIWEAKDVKAAVYLTIQSAYLTSGQRCSCARRLIVADNAQGDQMLKAIKTGVTKIRIGPCTDHPEPFMGPLINRAAAQRLWNTQDELQQSGAEVIVSLGQLSGAFLHPALIDVTQVKKRPDMEFFGPLLQVVRVKTFAEALAEANHTTFGLSAGLISDQADLYQTFWRESRAGVISWNRPTTGASSAAPFGGTGHSGNHRPGAYFAADYCSFPVASMEEEKAMLPEVLTPGIDLGKQDGLAAY